MVGNLTYEVLILDSFNWGKLKGELYFIRHTDNNPALVLKTADSEMIELSVNLPDFYKEYPFGEYTLVILRNDSGSAGIFTALFDAGIINKQVFSIDNNDEILPVCELTEQVVDLLKSCGEYYV